MAQAKKKRKLPRTTRRKENKKGWWNYRVVQVQYPDSPMYGKQIELVIKEVYYTKKGEICSMSVDPDHPSGMTKRELKQDLKYMMEAFEKPILIEKDIKFVPHD